MYKLTNKTYVTSCANALDNYLSYKDATTGTDLIPGQNAQLEPDKRRRVKCI